MRIFLYTVLALFGFALNSILCRMALRGQEADAVGFTVVRLMAGALGLVIISSLASLSETQPTRSIFKRGSWISAFLLFAYAICFSLAYVDLTAGTGALILFGSVQLTMIITSLIRGERPKLVEWVGLLIAAGGLAYLLLPGFESPPIKTAGLMAAAGVAWGFYTLRGKTSRDPLGSTTGNFIRAVPMIAVVAVFYLSRIVLTGNGLILAMVSGAVASGIGYAFWYAALKHHTSIRAAILQLPVPILTAFLGILFLDEVITSRLLIASALILGGIGMAIVSKGGEKKGRRRRVSEED